MFSIYSESVGGDLGTHKVIGPSPNFSRSMATAFMAAALFSPRLTGLKPNVFKALQGMSGLEAGASFVLGSPQERATSEASLKASEAPAEEEVSPVVVWEKCDGEHFAREDVATAAQTSLRAMVKRWFQ